MMIAVLNGGLRIEQGLHRRSLTRAIAALDQMEYDISLWQPDFFHTTEDSFFTGLRALFTVLEAVPGSKSMLLVLGSPRPSRTTTISSSPGLRPRRRCLVAAIYPVQARGLFVIASRLRLSECKARRSADAQRDWPTTPEVD